MKKRMFLSTILMTLVLVVALTTATFAWYQATTGDATLEGDSVEIATSSETYTIGDITFKLTLTDTSADPVGPTDQDGDNYVMINGQAQLIDTALYAKSGTISWSVEATVAQGDLTLAEALASLEGATYTVTLSGTDVRLAANGEAAIAAANGASTTVTFSVASGALVGASGTVAYAVDSTWTTAGGNITVNGSMSKNQ